MPDFFQVEVVNFYFYLTDFFFNLLVTFVTAGFPKETTFVFSNASSHPQLKHYICKLVVNIFSVFSHKIGWLIPNQSAEKGVNIMK